MGDWKDDPNAVTMAEAREKWDTGQAWAQRDVEIALDVVREVEKYRPRFRDDWQFGSNGPGDGTYAKLVTDGIEITVLVDPDGRSWWDAVFVDNGTMPLTEGITVSLLRIAMADAEEMVENFRLLVQAANPSITLAEAIDSMLAILEAKSRA